MRADYEIRDGKQVFSTAFQKAAPVNSLADIGKKVLNTGFDLVAINPVSKDASSLLSTTTNKASLARETGEIIEETAKSVSTIAEQAADISQQIGKNSISIKAPNKVLHYDLQGASHKGIETPHVQRSFYNTNSKGETFLNKDRKWVEPLKQQDIRTILNYLNRQ